MSGIFSKNRTIAGLLVMMASFASPPDGWSQATTLAMNAPVTGSAGTANASALERGRYAVVIDLDENMLHFKQGDVTLWSAPVGTGTGLRLETEDRSWNFATPRGTFEVKYKEENPTWIAPDWYFIENNLPIPPREDRRRFFPGGLGAAAVYIGKDLAIHGTDKPELLGQRVSHGCIRLSNKDALRLYHNVQVGTEVVIIGGEDLPEPDAAGNGGNDPATFSPGRRPPPPDAVLERWKKMSTGDLLDVLEDELWADPKKSRWSEVAGLLIRRGLDDDDDALRGILLRAGDLPDDRVEREYRTYVADIYTRRPVRTLEALSALNIRDRGVAADAIVAGLLGLYRGDFASHSAPWPSRRIPQDAVRSVMRRGWMAIDRAEQAFRIAGERRSV
jgi:lipoprotein-anchoring transpeptidase ErfK/SrfK